jgi:hypothetical protein
MDKETQIAVGLFNGIPGWYKKQFGSGTGGAETSNGGRSVSDGSNSSSNASASSASTWRSAGSTTTGSVSAGSIIKPVRSPTGPTRGSGSGSSWKGRGRATYSNVAGGPSRTGPHTLGIY